MGSAALHAALGHQYFLILFYFFFFLMNMLIHTAFLIGVYATAALGRPRVNNQLRTILGQYKRSRGYSGERGGGRSRQGGRGGYAGSGDTLLDDYFCQNYYDGGNMEDCHQLRAKVKYNHTRAV